MRVAKECTNGAMPRSPAASYAMKLFAMAEPVACHEPPSHSRPLASKVCAYTCPTRRSWLAPVTGSTVRQTPSAKDQYARPPVSAPFARPSPAYQLLPGDGILLPAATTYSREASLQSSEEATRS